MDIDASATSAWNAGAGFSPIGNTTNQFTGTYTGQDFKIRGLIINRPTQNQVGLFGRTNSPALISNLGIDGGTVTGLSQVGGLVGTNNGIVTACYATGAVSGGSDYVGGLVGNNISGGGILTTCYATGAVIGSSFVGGLVGYNWRSITTCYATGAVSGGSYVGGLVGNNNGIVNTSYAKGSVSGGNYVGGFIGYIWASNISSCYATGGVNGTSNVGGFVGFNNSTISNCYATGSVSGSSAVGGLVGLNSGGTYNNSFWDTQTTNQSTSAGVGAIGKTTTQMQTISTFTAAGWDFINETTNGSTDTWKMDICNLNNGYPVLALQETITTLTSAPIASNQSFCSGALVSSITATGANLKYYTLSVSGIALNPSSSITGSNLYVSQTINTCESKIRAQVVIQNSNTTITGQSLSQTVCGGTMAIFGITTTGASLSYAWSNGLSTTTSMLTSVVGNNYRVTVSGTCGTRISNTFSLSTFAGTIIATHPIPQIINSGSLATFSVSATGTNLSYKWNTGATTTGINTTVPGMYQVAVSGTCGDEISNAVSLKYNATVNGNNFTREYGSANPIFTGTILGLVNGDVINYSGTTAATSLSGVGVYAIVATATGANSNNYQFSIINSQLTITALAFVSTAPSPIVFNSNVFDNTPKVPSVVGLPSTSGVNYTYNGSSTAPTNAGSYTVVGIITDPNYTGTVTSVIVISPSDISNQLSVAGLSNSVYNGSPKTTSITGLPSGVASSVTYNGSTTAPTNAGTYTVVGIITDPNYTGTVTSVIVISPSDISNQLSVAGLSNSVYNGSPKATSITGLPSGVASSVTYNGSPTAPTNAGTYTVIGIVNDNNYVGTVTSVILISPSDISNQLSVAGLSNSVYNGSPKTTSITGLPSGVASSVTYNGSTIAPTNAGTYTVVGIITDPNYRGTVTSVIVILPVSATIVGNNATKVYGQPNPVFTGTVLGLVNNDVITYSGSTAATSLSGVGTFPIIATASGANVGNYQLLMVNGQLTVTPANSSASVSGILSDGNIVNATVPTSITISGSGFEPGASVTVNGVVLTNVILINVSTIIATLSAGSATSSNVSAIVQNPNQNPSALTAIVVVNANSTSVNSALIINNLQLTIHPNPNNGSFTISAAVPLGKVMIYTLDGKLVQTKTTTETKLFVSGISTGTYIVYVGKSSVKVVVE